MSLEVNVVPAVDPRSQRYRWVVSSKGGDGAFVRVACIDCGVSTREDPLGKTIAEISIPREVVDMVAMAVLYDQMKAKGITESEEYPDAR